MLRQTFDGKFSIRSPSNSCSEYSNISDVECPSNSGSEYSNISGDQSWRQMGTSSGNSNSGVFCVQKLNAYTNILKEKRAEKPGDICPKSLQLCCYTYAPHPHSQDLSTKFSIATCVHLASAKNRSTPSCAAVDHL